MHGNLGCGCARLHTDCGAGPAYATFPVVVMAQIFPSVQQVDVALDERGH